MIGSRNARLLRVTALAFAPALVAACSGGRDTASDEPASEAALLVSSDVVISQVYGGGGNSGATYTHDYVVLFNRGTSNVSLGGKSLQYASKSGTFSSTANVAALPNATLAPGQSYLVQLASNGATGSALPSPDLVTSGAEAFGLSSTEGKVALVDSSSLLSACGNTATPCTDGGWLDFVGYGGAQQAEVAGAPSLSNTTAAIRKGGGCVETGNNNNDFEAAAPSPKNTSSVIPCGSVTPDAGTGADAAPDVVTTPDAAGASLVLLNEVKINPPTSTDTPWEYAEILCTPGASLAGYYFVALEGDSDSSSGTPGTADIVVDLGGQTCGANGIVYIKAAGGGTAAQSNQSTVISTAALDGPSTSPFENATTSFVVIKSPSVAITQATDYDTNDDGTLDLPAGASLVDGIATFDQNDGAVDRAYAPILAVGTSSPDGAVRLVGDQTALSGSAWYAGELLGNADSLVFDAAKVTDNFPAGGALTPGAVNVGTQSATDGGTSTDASAGKDSGTKTDSGTKADGSVPPDDQDDPGQTPGAGGDAGKAKDAGKSNGAASTDDGTRASSSGCAVAPDARGGGGVVSIALGLLGLSALFARRRRA